MRDGDGLGDFRIEGDRLYWSDADGIYVTDGTAPGTQTLATPPEDDRTAPAVIGSIQLDDGIFERLGSLGADSSTCGPARADESIDAGAGRDVVRTGSGDDRIDGGVDADRMYGGAGNDVYLVDVARDVVVEKAREGSDRIYASTSYTLPAEVEWLQLTGQENCPQPAAAVPTPSSETPGTTAWPARPARTGSTVAVAPTASSATMATTR